MVRCRRVEELDGYPAEAHAREVLAGLGFDQQEEAS
jgi:hypothetical protein